MGDRDLRFIQFLELAYHKGVSLAVLKEMALWWVVRGGRGSGNYGHAGRPGHVGGSAAGSGRAQRAKETYVPATAEVQKQALENQNRLARHLGGDVTEDNHPFDVIVGSHAIEVKTIVRGKNDKITMHPDSLRRKNSHSIRESLTPHTVVFDDRHGHIYYSRGVGSFRLKSMQKVTLEEIREILKK